MKNLLAIIFLIFCTEMMVPDVSLAQKKFKGYPVAVHYDAWIDAWFSGRIDQDARGLIYILMSGGMINIYSGGGILETIAAPVDRRYHSIYAGPSGRVYVGGNDLGYYFPGLSGRYEYYSLNNLLPEPLQINGRNYIKKIFLYDGAIVFAKDDAYYFYKNDTIKVVSTGDSNGNGTIQYRGDLYNITRKGLCVFRDGNWDIVPNGHFFKDMNVRGLIEYSHDVMLVCTLKHGLYLVDRERITPFAPNALDYDHSTILSTLRLLDGNMAFGTRKNGLYIINPAGELVYHYNKENLLKPNSAIWNIFEDKFGNIWLIRPAAGIYKIEWNSPFSRIDQKFGLEGYGITAQVIGDQLYLGTGAGLYVSKNEWPLSQFSKVEEVDEAVHLIKNINDDWLVAGLDNLYQLTDSGFVLISDLHNLWSLVETKDPDIILGGNWLGIHKLEKANGFWSLVTKYKDSDHVAPAIVFDERDRLWATSSKGIYSFSFTEDYKSIDSSNHYTTSKGLPYSHGNKPIKLGDQFVLTTLKGIYEYDQQADIFKPSEIWNDRLGHYGSSIWRHQMDDLGNIYYLNFQYPYPRRLKRDRWNEFTNEPHLLANMPVDRGIMANISIIDESSILFGYKEGFVHYDVASQNDGPGEINLLIRYVRLSRSDSLLFGGHFTHNDKVEPNQPTGEYPKIAFEENSLVIGYSAVEFNNYSQNYRYLLEGYNDEWSSWTSETEQKFMNLWEGDYTFKVEAKNVNGEILTMQTYRFRILPPWHRSWYAYIIYVLGVLGILGGLFLVYRRRKLEQITRLEKKQLGSELQHKQSQLATTAMHLIEKTDFLGSIKARLFEILKDENKDVNRELKRIIREIDRNAKQEDVWEDFEEHFDAVHTGFIQKLQKDYPRITPQELKLSAYLRMNLSTKEIANLIQITARSAEVARYRLRKKLSLGSEENLASFMMNY